MCFTSGTKILTNKGEKLIETLRVGDLIATRDNGYQPLRWVGSKTVPAYGSNAPVCISKGVLGNTRNLIVSPNHRMLIEASSNDLLFGESEVLVCAKHLCNSEDIVRIIGGSVTYMHILFEKHEVVFANGAPSESFFPGDSALNTLSEPSRMEVLELFPELAAKDHATFNQTARLCLKHHEARLLHAYR